jgi:hypothetical protein
MSHRLTWLTLALGVAALLFTTCGYAVAPIRKPGGPVDVGPGSLEATRRALEGSWTLVSLDVVDAQGGRRRVTAAGDLNYDAFGSMTVRGVIEDPALRSTLVIDYSGRIVIDPARNEFYPADLVSDRPVDPSQIAPIAPDKVRRFELTADSLVVTYLDASSKPTAVLRWQRTGAPR